MNDLKNFRPVSNLPFLSKILEKVVLAQLESNLSRNSLREVCQSAYRQNHSTETLLLSVTDSLLCKADNRLVSLLTLLDQSAAFDTIDHKILLNRLSYSFWYQWHCVQVVHILSYQQNTVCFCGRLKLFAFALEIWCSPRFCPWPHPFYPILSTCFWQN